MHNKRRQQRRRRKGIAARTPEGSHPAGEDAYREDNVAGPVLGPEPRILQPAVQESKVHEDQRNQHNGRASRLSRWTLIVLCIYTTFAGWQGYEMRRSVLSAQRSVATAQQTAENAAKQFGVSERPWLAADLKVIYPLTFDSESGTGKVGIEVLLKNMGRSIATDARVIQYLTADLVTPQNVGVAEDEACGPLRKSDAQLGNVLFPGETMRLTDKVVIEKAVVDAAVRRVTALGRGTWNGRIIPGLITCIDYTSPLSPVHHQTRYFSLVGERLDDFSQTGAIFPIGVYKVQLWRLFFGQYAD